MIESNNAMNELRAVDWANTPSLFAALGYSVSNLDAETLSNKECTVSTVIAKRNILSRIGDKARHNSKIVEDLCVELVNLTGAALSFLDATV